MKILILLCLSLQLLPRANSQEEPPRIIRPPVDSTVLVYGRKTLYCEATGNPRPTITWYKFDWKLQESDRNYRISKAGALRFRKAYITDTGKYKCIAKNSRGEVHSQYISFNVKAPAVIVRGPTDRTVFYGTTLVLACVAMGIPMPEILWLKNGTVIKDGASGYNFSSPRLVINATETARYSCEIRNRILNKVHLDRKESTVTVLGAPKVDTPPTKELPKDEGKPKPTEGPVPPVKPPQPSEKPATQKPDSKKPVGFCAPYNGSMCQQYIGNRSVFFNSSYDNPEQVHESIVKGLWEEMLSTFDMACRGPAEKMLCHYAFPDCDITRGNPVPAPICREHCYAVKDLYCLSEWLLLADNINNGIYISSSGHFSLPVCATLPSRHNSSENCTNVKVYENRPDLKTSTCYKGTGQYYIGTVNVTKDGIACQTWEAGTPHLHRRPPEIFPELENSYNYCRNPGSEHEAPWCYTMDINIRWQSCDIPKCDANITTGEVSEDPVLAKGNGLSIDLVSLVIITLVSVLTIGIVILITVLCHRLYLQDRRLQYNVTNQDDMDIDLSRLPSNAIYELAAPMSFLNPKLEALEYSRNDIVYIRDIGQGAFGRVFQASCCGLLKGEDVTLAAVKMLKEDATEDLHLDFEREASLMADFYHPNIVKLLGVCAIGKPLCLLFEFMSRGDLHGFLKLCSPDNNNTSPDSGTDLIPSNHILTKLEYLDQLNISLQVAAGMEYLAGKKYVHRDLATRNCLVGENLIVKISDFGLARSIENGDYYIGDEHDAIPIRWTPIEAVLYNKFTVESDVWSFGVVLWEIFSYAQQPYSEMSHEEVIKFVKDGSTMSPPPDTSQEICEVMQHCWHRKASSRPSFQTLHRSLKALVEEYSNKTNKVYENHNHRQ
ncbi:muscle, skeletal receptor tyrosine protein kinase-like isoform X2 [Lineus longissimus]|uniref:muscle, skeletal receptor tyrosine protein kinase-like isoform X2 n=1 Tax=Lineus longissimus TaxID=88925 RepID=UPI00315C8697